MPTGADLCLLRGVLNDWPDREEAAILSRRAEAARPNGRVVTLSRAGPDVASKGLFIEMAPLGGKHSIGMIQALEVTHCHRTYVARLEIVDGTNQMAMTFRYKALGGSKGAKLSASVGGTHEAWQYVTTSEPLTFDDFVGHADHVGESVAFGYGYSVDRFILHGPLHKGGSVCVKFASWGYATRQGLAKSSDSEQDRPNFSIFHVDDVLAPDGDGHLVYSVQ